MPIYAKLKDANKNNILFESIDDSGLAFLDTRDPSKTSKTNPDGVLIPAALNVARAKMLVKGLQKFIDAHEKKAAPRVQLDTRVDAVPFEPKALVQEHADGFQEVVGVVHETPTDVTILEPGALVQDAGLPEDTSQLAANEA